MHMKKLTTVTILVCGILAGYHHSAPQQKTSVVDGKIKRLKPFGMPDTAGGNYFSGVNSLACTDDGKLFLSDQQTGSIRVFSLETGKELYKFGKIGSGPGEFRTIGRLNMISGQRIAVLDNTLLRCSIFFEDGRLQRTIPLKSRVDDIAFIGDDAMVVCTFMFDLNFKPLRLMRISTSSVLAEFGEIVDPRRGLIETFDALAPDNRDLSTGWMGNVLVASQDQQLIYSQRHPYVLVKYDLASRSGVRFNMGIDIDVEDQLFINRTEGFRNFEQKPSGQVLTPKLCGSIIIVPIFSVDGQTNYLDCYADNLQLKARYRIPALPKNVWPIWSTFKSNSELLVLVRDRLRINWVERFSIDIAYKSTNR